MESFEVRTSGRTDFREISGEVQAVVGRTRVADGLAVIYVPHTTAGITINEHADPSVMQDLAAALERLVPWEHPSYRHGEGNSAAHVKASLMGSSVTIPVVRGRLVLGPWQGVFLCEFDGPRTRRVLVQVCS